MQEHTMNCKKCRVEFRPYGHSLESRECPICNNKIEGTNPIEVMRKVRGAVHRYEKEVEKCPDSTEDTINNYHWWIKCISHIHSERWIK